MSVSASAPLRSTTPDHQLDRAVPDDQSQPIAFHELGSRRREQDLVGRQQLRPPLAQRNRCRSA